MNHENVSRCGLMIVLALGLGFGASARAQESPKPKEAAGPEPTKSTRSARGGTLVKTDRHQFEIFFYQTGLRIFPRSLTETPVKLSRLSGTATFYLPGAPNPFVYDLKGTAPTSGREPESVDLVLDLSRVPVSGSKVTFKLDGLTDAKDSSTTFTVPFVLTATASNTPRRTAPAVLRISSASRADQAAINAQRVCAVSGESLGSMGVPVKVTRGDRAVFLCCRGCVRTVQANPDLYFGRQD